jgi:glycosyltransferase involved in cell wall biosynthesis
VPNNRCCDKVFFIHFEVTMVTHSTAPEICVWEDDPSGHRLAFVEILVRYIWEKTGRNTLLVISEEVLKSAQYRIFLKNLGDRFETHLLGKQTCRNTFSIGSRFLKVSDFLKRRNIRELIIPTADVIVKILGIARLFGWNPLPLNIRCVLLFLGFPYADRSFLLHLKDWLSFLLKKMAPVHAFYIDTYAAEIARIKYGYTISTIPEPLLSLPSQWPRKTRRPNSSRNLINFGCVGRFDYRKGADLLLDAFQEACPPKWRLLLAGTMLETTLVQKAESIRSARPEKMLFRNEVLSNDVYWEFLEQIDVVCLPYRGHVGTSQVFAQAAALGKIIIASDYGWLGAEGKKYNKTRFFRNGSLASLVKCMEDTAMEIDALDTISGNYVPASEKSFAQVLCGF